MKFKLVATHDNIHRWWKEYDNSWTLKTNSMIDGDKLHHLNLTEPLDIWTFKIDGNGKLWDKAISQYEDMLIVSEIIAMPDGSIYFALSTKR